MPGPYVGAGIGRGVASFGQALLQLAATNRAEARYKTDLAERRADREALYEYRKNQEARLRETGAVTTYRDAFKQMGLSKTPEEANAVANAYGPLLPGYRPAVPEVTARAPADPFDYQKGLSDTTLTATGVAEVNPLQSAADARVAALGSAPDLTFKYRGTSVNPNDKSQMQDILDFEHELAASRRAPPKPAAGSYYSGGLGRHYSLTPAGRDSALADARDLAAARGTSDMGNYAALDSIMGPLGSERGQEGDGSGFLGMGSAIRRIKSLFSSGRDNSLRRPEGQTSSVPEPQVADNLSAPQGESDVRERAKELARQAIAQGKNPQDVRVRLERIGVPDEEIDLILNGG